VRQLAVEHCPDLIDGVRQLIAAVFDVHRRRRVRNENAVDVGQPPHQPTSSSDARVLPRPSDLSLRCKAERSIPMKAAVREILPENRSIWALRYSRSIASRA